MPEVLDWKTIPDPRSAVRRAVRALRAGRVVALPSEAEYLLAASALHPEAIERLRSAAPLSVAVGSVGLARDWVPAMGQLAQRLARRFWPGPVSLSFGSDPAGLVRRLPDRVRPFLSPEGKVRLRSPAHEATLDVLRRLDLPLALAEVPIDPETNLAGLVRTLEPRADLILLDGPCAYPEGTTAVEVEGNTWRIEKPGTVTEELLRRQSACVVIFICTGNTCRSPLAEALLKKRLADRLGCSPGELPARGYHILSAGLAAAPGGPAAEEACTVAARHGGDLSSHRSRPLSAELVAQADYLIAMTQSHAATLASIPRSGCRPRLLRADGQDVADPIGHSREVYEECGRQIWSELEALAAEIAPEVTAPPSGDSAPS